MKPLDISTNELMDILNVMDRAGFTQSELNNDRLRAAVRSVMVQADARFRAAGVWDGQTFKTYRKESLDRKTMYVKD